MTTIVNAVIKEVNLWIGYDCLMISIEFLTSDGMNIKFRRSLCSKDEITNTAGFFIAQLLETITGKNSGASIKDIEGKFVRLEINDEEIVSIGHILFNFWLITDAEKWNVFCDKLQDLKTVNVLASEK